jgi:hypothetical protein
VKRIDRLLGAIPLASILLWLAIVQMWDTVGRKSPTLFTDELEWTQISRAIAATGHPARRGEPIFFKTLYVYLIAPVWWIHDTATAYDAAKYLNAAVMALTAIPAYLLVRRYTSKPTALVAAAATICVPAMVYADYLVPEALAYPWSMLCAYLVVQSLSGRGRRWTIAAIAACSIAPLVRFQLAVLPVAYALAAFGLWWAGPRARALRARWTTADQVGFWLLVAGAFIVFNRAILHHSYQWWFTTEFWRGRMLQHAIWAWGALTIGIGFLPTTAGLLALFPRPEERVRRDDRALIAFLWAGLFAFLFYTGLKGAFLSTQFATRVVERNLIYAAPLLIVATAVVLERRRIRLLPLLGAAALTIFLVAYVPIQLDFPYYEAFGFSMLDLGNRVLNLPQAALQSWSIAIAAVLAVLPLGLWLADRRGIRARLPIRAVTGVAAALVIAWGLTGQIYLSRGTADESAYMLSKFPLSPPNEIDRITGGRTVTYLGQPGQTYDPNGIHLLEFWNRSVKNVWSLDGNAPGPGPSLSPDLARADGTLRPSPPTPYVLTDDGVQLVGTPILQVAGTNLRLYRVGRSWRLSGLREGVFSDGWMALDSAYSGFVGGRHGTLVVTLSRKAIGCTGGPPPGEAIVELGPLRVNANHQPELVRATRTLHVKVENCKATLLPIKVGPPPWRVQVHFNQLFRPSDYGINDGRQLGAQVNYTYKPS